MLLSSSLRFISWLLAPLALLAACTSTPEQKFARAGVAFTCPSGWKLDTAGIADDPNAVFLTCEKQGLNASGMLTLGWVNDSLALDDALATQQESLRSNVLFKNTNLQFQPAVDSSYHGHPAKLCRYTFSLLGLQHAGQICCCYGSSKTLFLMRQEALEDQAANAPGFAALEQSLTW